MFSCLLRECVVDVAPRCRLLPRSRNSKPERTRTLLCCVRRTTQRNEPQRARASAKREGEGGVAALCRRAECVCRASSPTRDRVRCCISWKGIEEERGRRLAGEVNFMTMGSCNGKSSGEEVPADAPTNQPSGNGTDQTEEAIQAAKGTEVVSEEGKTPSADDNRKLASQKSRSRRRGSVRAQQRRAGVSSASSV